FKYRNREFWCRGYYVDTVGKNTAKIQDYIKHQLEEDKMGEQLSIPYPGSPFTGRYLKGKSSLMLYEQFGDLKFKYRNREFWCRGYYVDTVGKNTAKIQDYIKHQLEEDKMGEQLSIPYPGSPFTGRK
uniref:transposase n=1 Tax=Salmonella enterica TaxID=28901 RepID=UPI001F197383